MQVQQSVKSVRWVQKQTKLEMICEKQVSFEFCVKE